MDDLIYRHIQPDELWFLKDMLFEAIYLPPEEKKNLTRDILDLPKIKLYHEEWGREGDIAIVAVDNDELVGCIWTRLFTKENPGYGFIDETIPEVSVAVIEEYRNIGIGTTLFSLIIEKCRKAGFKQLSLSVDAVNTSVNLYKRVGFSVFSEKEGTYTMQMKL